MSKVSIIGSGEVGASCAMCIAERDFVNEITIVDVKEGLSEGKSLDLRQSAALKRFDTKILGYTDDYSRISGSDVVIITSGITRKPGMSRDDLMVTNAYIIKNVTEQIVKYSPNAVVIVVSNPLDVMCYCAQYYSQFPSNRILGMSGMLDVARYKYFISELLDVSTKDIQALILGGHGKSMVPMPRYTTIGGIPIRNLLSEENVQDAIHRTQLGGEEIISHLGRSGWYAAGAAVCEMVEAIVCDQHRVFPVCAHLNGEYGYKNIYLGVPVILGKNGVERVIELELDNDDNVKFMQSYKEVQKNVDKMKALLNI